MKAKTLDGRLLCVSGAAYSIICNGPAPRYDPNNVYDAGAGFVRPPSPVVRGENDVDACLVGEIDDGVVVAFRGTLPFDIHQVPTLLDWLQDLDAQPIAAPEFFPGCVHSGFFSAFTNLRQSLVNELNSLAGKISVAKPLLITGHSKGGALAALMGWHAADSLGIPAKVVTFAGARSGDAAFATAYDAKGIVHVRYEYGDDIVPHLPPSENGFIDHLASIPLIGSRFQGLRLHDYRSVGTLRYIDEAHRFYDDFPGLRTQRNMTLALEIVQGHFAQIAADHAIGCGSGYMSAIAPEVCS